MVRAVFLLCGLVGIRYSICVGCAAAAAAAACLRWCRRISISIGLLLRSSQKKVAERCGGAQATHIRILTTVTRVSRTRYLICHSPCLLFCFFVFFSSAASSLTGTGELDSKELYRVVAGILPGDFEVRVHTSEVSGRYASCVVVVFSQSSSS